MSGIRLDRQIKHRQRSAGRPCLVRGVLTEIAGWIENGDYGCTRYSIAYEAVIPEPSNEQCSACLAAI
jgi:hypothetical protein